MLFAIKKYNQNHEKYADWRVVVVIFRGIISKQGFTVSVKIIFIIVS